MKRGIATVAALREHSVFDPRTFCWHWQGAKSTEGVPRIWAFDHERGDKRVMPGPKAVWNIAFARAPRGLAFRRCGCTDCVNPAHHGEAPDKAAIGLHVRRAGWRKGTHVEQRRASLAKAQRAAGVTPTPAHIVAAIRSADPKTTNVAMAAQFGITHQTVSEIRRGNSRRDAHLEEEEQCASI